MPNGEDQQHGVPAVDWYERRDELESGQIFRTNEGCFVMLDRRVPGDGTKWYVADWWNGWTYEDGTVEPGDLVELLTADAAEKILQKK